MCPEYQYSTRRKQIWESWRIGASALEMHKSIYSLSTGALVSYRMEKPIYVPWIQGTEVT